MIQLVRSKRVHRNQTTNITILFLSNVNSCINHCYFHIVTKCQCQVIETQGFVLRLKCVVCVVELLGQHHAAGSSLKTFTEPKSANNSDNILLKNETSPFFHLTSPPKVTLGSLIIAFHLCILLP